MKKTTTTLLTAAGLLFLAGCKTEVMNNRRYQGDPPQEDPAMKQNAPETFRTPERDVSPTPKPSSRFTPMTGTYSGEGIEDETPRRRSPRRKGGKAVYHSAAKGGIYIVKPGDTLGRIAYRHKVSVAALRQANNRTAAQDRFLRPGTKLVIPGGKAAAPRKTAVKRAGRRAGLNADGTYTMVKGDNIPKVARKFGIRAKVLQQANNLTDEETTRLQIGHKLIIPTGGKAAAPRKRAAVKRSAPAKPASAPRAEEQAAPALPPAPTAEDSSAASSAPALPPAPVAETSAAAGNAALPPPAPVENAASSGTKFVSVAGYTSLEDFAAKNNTTVEELIKLNPRIDRSAPISTYEMLYVPGK